MDKRAKLIALAVIGLVGVIALAWAWWPESKPSVDPAIVETAAESARQAAQQQPPQAEEPKYEGKAKPGLLGGK